MVTEDYVSYETAKLLKEKGFDGQCLSKYNSNGCIWNNIRYDGMLLGNNDIFPQEYLAPTLQMAMKWLREKGFIISSIPDFRFNKLLYTNLIINTNGGPQQLASELYNTYEEACEAGIRYCLENLI